MSNVKLYYNPNIQTITYDNDRQGKVENLPMNLLEIKIYKNSNNTIDFSVRNNDRQPINLLDKTLTAYISNTADKEVVIVKELELIDKENGFARLSLLEGDIDQLKNGYYKYSIIVNEDNGRQGYVKFDQTYEVIGEFVIDDSAILNNDTTFTVDVFNNLRSIEYVDIKTSGAIPSSGKNLHTFALYLDKFIGEVIVEATLDEVPSAYDTSWVKVHSKEYTDEITAIEYSNVNGKYTYFRVSYVPSEFNEGSMTKAIYK